MFQSNYDQCKRNLEDALVRYCQQTNPQAKQYVYIQFLSPYSLKYRKALWTPRLGDSSSRQGIHPTCILVPSQASVIYLCGIGKIVG